MVISSMRAHSAWWPLSCLASDAKNLAGGRDLCGVILKLVCDHQNSTMTSTISVNGNMVGNIMLQTMVSKTSRVNCHKLSPGLTYVETLLRPTRHGFTHAEEGLQVRGRSHAL